MGTHSPDNREWSFEYLRVLAAFGVVWFHTGTQQFHWLGASGLYVFFMISLLFFARSSTDKPLTRFTADKMRRLLAPWLFWSSVYLLVGLYRFWRHGKPFFEPWMLGTGFCLHLWYLPFLFCALVALYWLRRSWPFFDTPSGVAVLSVVGLAALAANGALRPPTLPFCQWMAGFPIVLLGFAFGRTTLVPDARRRRVAGSVLVAGILAVCALRFRIPAWHTEDDQMVLYGVLAFLALRSLPLPETAAVRVLSPLTLGIYLMHPLVRDILGKAFGEENSPLRVVMVFTACALAAYVLRKVPLIRKVV